MRKPSIREILLVVVMVCLAVYVSVWRYQQNWHPKHTIESTHYTFVSSATLEQTYMAAAVAESLFAAHSILMSDLGVTNTFKGRMAMYLYRNRSEFRRVNNAGWEEAFYKGAGCHMYYDRYRPNPYHWMLHEGTHQLNEEVADLCLPLWLNEGLATYLGTSTVTHKGIDADQIDLKTYPAWHLRKLARTEDIEQEKAGGRFLSLEIIVGGHQGPPLDEKYNLYYLHWWMLVHFLLEYDDGKYRGGMSELLKVRCTPRDFIQHIGPFDEIEVEWFEHMRAIRRRELGD